MICHCDAMHEVYVGPADYRCLRPVHMVSGLPTLYTMACSGLMRLLDGCVEPVLVCDNCGRVAALEPVGVS